MASILRPHPQIGGVRLASRPIAWSFALFALLVTIGAVVYALPALGPGLLLAVGTLVFLIGVRRPSDGIMALLFASLFSALMIPVRLGSTIIDIRPDQVALLAVLAVFVLGLINGQLRLYRTELDLPILGLVGSNALSSALFSPVRGDSLKSVALMVIYVSIYFVTVNLLLAQPLARLRHIMVVFVSVGVAQAWYGLLVIIGYGAGISLLGIQIGQASQSSVSLAGTFYEANLLGIYLAIIGTCLLAYLTLGGVVGPWLFRLLLSLGLVCAALTLTITRSAWMAFALAVCFMLGLSAWRRRSLLRVPRTVAITMGGICLALLLITLFLVPLQSQLSQQNSLFVDRFARLLTLSDYSIRGRMDSYAVALERWQAKPVLGWGTFAGEEIGQRWFNGTLVQALHDTGVVGAFFLLWMHAVSIWVPWRASKQAVNSFDRSSLVALSLGNAILFLTSQTSSFYWLGFPWLFMGLTIAYAHADRRR